MLKAGDKIRIKTWEEMLDYENIYEDIYGNLCKRGDNTEYFIPSMKKYCNRIIYLNDYNDETVYHNGWKFFPWTYEILEENKTNVIVEQSKTGQKLSLFSDKTPILSDGDIIKDKEGNVGIVLNNYIRYSKCSTLINTDNISKIYKVKENNPCGYKDILNSFEIDRYCDVIWERLEIEQSLDELEIGTKVKVKNKLLNIAETLTVGRFNSNKVLIRDGLTCYNFNSDKYEILEIIK